MTRAVLFLRFPVLSATNVYDSLVLELSIPSRSVVSLSVSYHLLSVMFHFLTSGPTNIITLPVCHIKAGTTKI